MKKLATIEIYIGKDLPHGGSASFATNPEGTNWVVQIDMQEEADELAKRGIKTTPRERFEGPLVHELGHIVEHLTKTEPYNQVKVEERAWALGAKMGHVNPKVVKAAVGSYEEILNLPEES